MYPYIGDWDLDPPEEKPLRNLDDQDPEYDEYDEYDEPLTWHEELYNERY
jgi:hypothetical protein